jgi:hypothetical protein
VEPLLQLRTLCDHPPVDGRVIHVHPTFAHAFFDMTRAQRIASYQRIPIRMTSGGKWAPLQLIAIVALPHDTVLLREEEHTSKRLK